MGAFCCLLTFIAMYLIAQILALDRQRSTAAREMWRLKNRANIENRRSHEMHEAHEKCNSFRVFRVFRALDLFLRRGFGAWDFRFLNPNGILPQSPATVAPSAGLPWVIVPSTFFNRNAVVAQSHVAASQRPQPRCRCAQARGPPGRLAGSPTRGFGLRLAMARPGRTHSHWDCCAAAGHRPALRTEHAVPGVAA
jgi:hypothetical protein